MRTILLIGTIFIAALMAATLPLSTATADSSRGEKSRVETQDKMIAVTGTLDRWSILADGRVEFALRPRDPEAGKTRVWFRSPGPRDGEARFAQLALSVFVEASTAKEPFILTAHGEADVREDGDSREAALTLERIDHRVRVNVPLVVPGSAK